MNTEEKNRLETSMRIKILLVLVTIILIVLMFPKGESIESDVSVGTIWIQDDLIASTTFEILKDPEIYAREKKNASENIHMIFQKNESLRQTVKDSLKNYSKKFLNILDQSILSGNGQMQNNVFLSQSSFDVFKNLRRRENILSAAASKKMQNVFEVSLYLADKIYEQGLLDVNFDRIPEDSISIREGRIERVIPKSSFFDNASAQLYINNYLQNNFRGGEELNKAVVEYMNHFVIADYVYNKSLTDEAIKTVEDRVPRNEGIVNENERIVAKHDRITKDIKAKIDSYRIAKGEETGFWGRFAQNLGKFLHIIAILTLFVIYIYLFRKNIYNDNIKILLIAIVILFVNAIAFLVFRIDTNMPVELLVFVPVASMLITIIFDSRMGFYATIVVALIVGALRGNDYVFAVMNIVAGGLGAYTVRDIKNRNQIFRSFFYILIGYIISITAFGLESFESFDELIIQAGFAAVNALFSAVLTYGLIIFFERIFKITTDLTLLELSDFNTPLLKTLAQTAPGSFTHSMTIGSMVENAATEIGANPILARVGAYYHDIGKTLEPDIFVENQLDNKNIHEELSPEKSAEIIINHVKQGIGLAKEHKLPKEIIDFIPMHHGTMFVSYFYEKAKEKYGEENVNIDDYRYPGPKPNTKETALIMLADACESTVRSMTDPEVNKIENVINNLFKIRINDGQLDNSPITLRDLKKIKETFLKTLLVQHHKRIRYPKQEEIENQSSDK
ncbi:MAG: hydrolase [Ignavibacteria bacterium GWB2_35_6b]|nr:MAG: hydrolase [Ignavibacteria bacterium GWB2_35_6b]